jgi:hypothetical protein
MLEILVGLAILLILKRLCPDKCAVRRNDSDIIPFIDHHDHRDGTVPFGNTDFDRNWDSDFIDNVIDENILEMARIQHTTCKGECP